MFKLQPLVDFTSARRANLLFIYDQCDQMALSFFII